MRETWYVLESGKAVDPCDCGYDDKGVLRHKSGAAIAMKSFDAHMTRGVDLDAEPEAKEPKEPKKGSKPAKPAADRQMKAGKPKKYETR